MSPFAVLLAVLALAFGLFLPVVVPAGDFAVQLAVLVLALRFLLTVVVPKGDGTASVRPLIGP